jgi:hypothetical protein
MEDINDIYRHAINRLGEGVYFVYNKETGKTYALNVKAEKLSGQPTRLYIEEGNAHLVRFYIDNPDFSDYISGLELVGVVQLGIPYNKPNYIPLNFS